MMDYEMATGYRVEKKQFLCCFQSASSSNNQSAKFIPEGLGYAFGTVNSPKQ